jgi:hypothetical protein
MADRRVQKVEWRDDAIIATGRDGVEACLGTVPEGWTRAEFLTALFGSAGHGDRMAAYVRMPPWPDMAETVRLALVALRAHDPAAHAAIIREQAAAAGLRVLTAEEALAPQAWGRDWARMHAWGDVDHAAFAALRGDHPGGEVRP